MTFDGWYTEEGDCVDAEAPLHLTGDTTLSARWTQAEPQSAEAALLTYDPDAPITNRRRQRRFTRWPASSVWTPKPGRRSI